MIAGRLNLTILTPGEALYYLAGEIKIKVHIF